MQIILCIICFASHCIIHESQKLFILLKVLWPILPMNLGLQSSKTNRSMDEILKNWIIFDVMGVIFVVGDDTNNLLVPFVQKNNDLVTKDMINKLYIEASLGKISSKIFWKRVELIDKYPGIEKEYLNTQLIIDPDFKQVSRRLMSKYRLGIISNDLSNWSKFLRKKFDLDFFQEVIISGDVGVRKPDKSIYDIFIDKANVSPEKCVFIDDRSKNLIPAAALGMKTIRFKREIENSDFNPDYEINSFLELEDVINRIF